MSTSVEARLITDLLKKYLELLIEDYDASFLHSSLLQGKLKLDEFKINCRNLNALNKEGAFTGIDVDGLELDVSLQHSQPFVSAKLKCKKSGDAFCVSTYHMPCLFGSDPKVQVMTYHAALAAQQVRKFADGLPCVLAGDFNFMPGTAPYRLVTDGVLPPDEPHLPPMPEQDSWQPTVPQPFESAYVASGAGEPEFTNLATTQFMPNEPFIGTLDYIFLSSGDWAVTSVKPLKKIDSVLPVCKSYPNADEPSDHVCIWADVELKPKK